MPKLLVKPAPTDRKPADGQQAGRTGGLISEKAKRARASVLLRELRASAEALSASADRLLLRLS